MYDMFVSHASEDKDTIALKLVLELKKAGLNIWYDSFKLHLGDDLEKEIDKGLSLSKYGIVILSPYFFNKDWTQKELNILINKEKNNKKIILPILHNITVEEVEKYIPDIKNRIFANTIDGIENVINKIFQSYFYNLNSNIKNDQYSPYMNLDEIFEKCINSTKHNMKTIGDSLNKFELISKTDIEMAVMKANIIKEYVLKEVYQLEFDVKYQDDNINYFTLLNSKNALGRIVASHCEAIYKLNKIAALNSEPLTYRELLLCKQSLEVILNWFINTYLNKVLNKKSLSIVFPHEFTNDDLEEVYNIETRCFQMELISPPEIVKEWYEHNNETHIGVRDSESGKLVGFFNTLPITDELFERIESGNYIDTHIPTTDILQYYLPGYYKLYLCSFCIDPGYRKDISTFNLLYKSFIDYLIKLALDRCIFITQIIADAITNDGERLCKHLNMELIISSSHKSKIYKATLLPPSMNLSLKGTEGLKLMEFYKEKYQEFKKSPPIF